jgi:hypothetical protein
MKVNFWQILGIILIILGVVFFARKKIGNQDKPPQSMPVTTTPATQPAP